MKPAKGRYSWRKRATRKLAEVGLSSLLGLFAGCQLLQTHEVEQTLISNYQPPPSDDAAVAHYLVSSPDVLEITVAGRSVLSNKLTIGADGRISLDQYGSLRVEGHKVEDIALRLSEVYGVPATSVSVQVAEYRSQHVVLFGQVVGWQRTVPYQGQETVLELLHRTGGITKGASPEKVFVVRPNIFEGKRPEIFHVDLERIASHEDESSNIRVRPFDQIYVGETRQAKVERFMPKWIRPIYQFFWDTRPDRDVLEKEAQEQHRVPWMVGNSSTPPPPPKTPRRLPSMQSSGLTVE